MTTTILLLIVVILFSALFSGMEIAFVSSNKLLHGIDRNEDSLTSGIINKFYDNSNNFISSLLVGNNIVLVIYGMLMAKLLNVPISEVWNMVRIENTSISTMKVHDNGDVEIVRWGDDSHLPEELKTGYVRIAGFVQKKYNADYDVIKVEGSHNFPPFAV